LNDRAEHDRVVLAELPSMDVPKTRDLLGFLGALKLEGKTLILTNGNNTNVHRSARNLKAVEVLPFGTESVYDVLWAHTVVIELDAIKEPKAAPAPKAKKEKPEAEAAPEAADEAASDEEE
jgi:large subunit ribosomal protein L4